MGLHANVWVQRHFVPVSTVGHAQSIHGVITSERKWISRISIPNGIEVFNHRCAVSSDFRQILPLAESIVDQLVDLIVHDVWIITLVFNVFFTDTPYFICIWTDLGVLIYPVNWQPIYGRE